MMDAYGSPPVTMLLLMLLLLQCFLWTSEAQTVSTVLSTTFPSPSSSASVDSYHRITEDFWQWRLEQSPEFATSVGIHRHNNRLETFTLEAFRHRRNACEEFLRRMEGISIRSLTEDQYINLHLLKYDIQTYVTGYDWRLYMNLNPLNFVEGLHKDYSFWLDAMPFDTEEDFRMYLNRLRALATQINEQINLMRDAIGYGWTNHRVSMETIPEAINSLLTVSPAETPFYRPFNDSLEFADLSSNKADILSHEGLAVIQDQLLPSYIRLNKFLNKEYMPQARLGYGMSSLQDGGPYYQACITWHLAEQITPQQLHTVGRRRQQQIQQQLVQLKRRSGYIGTLKDFLKYSQHSNKFFFKNQKGLLKEYRKYINDKIPMALSQLFKIENISEIHVQPMPFDGPVGVMVPGSDDGTLPPTFFVNVKNLQKRPKWQIPTVAMHETFPGKYLQTNYQHSIDMPMARKVKEYRKQFAIPFQFPFHAAFSEGWALYAESLAKEMGFFSNPYTEFGQLYSEFCRACEMVVDTGIHTFEWTKEEAVGYLIENTGIDRKKAAAIVDRIITFPGQATGPEYANMKLRQLRDKAEAILGDNFDIREFHHQILRLGTVPLGLLDSQIARWISINRSSKSDSLHSKVHVAIIGHSVALLLYIVMFV